MESECIVPVERFYGSRTGLGEVENKSRKKNSCSVCLQLFTTNVSLLMELDE